MTRIIKTAAHIAHDTDIADRVKYAQSTVAAFTAGKPVTGGPKLADHLGEDVVVKMRSWLKTRDQDAIDEMNQKHFFVRHGADSVIGREEDDEIVFQRTGALAIEYANRRAATGTNKKGGPEVKPLFQAWLESPTRRSYRKVVFAPPPIQPDPRDYNLWKGFAVPPAPGDCSLFLWHLHHVICSGNDEHSRYLMKLLAFTVQQPGIPSEVATVLRGEPGTGKGFFVRAIGDIFGRHAVHLDKVDHLVGKFNASLSAKVVVFADEAFWAGDERDHGALKRLITEPTLMIERKGIDSIQEKNCVHLFIASNEEWAIPAMLKERRYFCVERVEYQATGCVVLRGAGE